MSFAFKIDKALKANLYKICRLCGIDREDSVPIHDGQNAMDDTADCEGDLKLHQKIKQCIGLMVSKDDKMPQSACTLCVDKINDFYEFREMCYATDLQTRKLLGLKQQDVLKRSASIDVKPTKPTIKPIIKPIKQIKPTTDIKEETTAKRGRKRKHEEVVSKEATTDVKSEPVVAPVTSNKKQRLSETLPLQKKIKPGKQKEEKTIKPKDEVKEEPPLDAATPNKEKEPAVKFRQVCSICNERFGSKVKLEQHLAAAHIPNIPRYVCTACNEIIKKTNDIKSHQLWHKLSKTPYVCGLCDQALISSYAYSRHLRDHSIPVSSEFWVLDRQCPQCHQTFITNFLYNTHPCAVRAKKCAGCNRMLRNELEYQRHAAYCSKAYLNYSKHIPAAALAAESSVRIKNENDVEAAAAAEALARNAGMSLDMAPVVSLVRISTPEIMAATHGELMSSNELIDKQVAPLPVTKSGKKGSRKGVSKKELKRVDELLKSTLDALVNIKHEPEVHVHDEPPESPSSGNDNEGQTGAVDDFHHGDDDDVDNTDDNINDIPVSDTAGESTISIKMEQNDSSCKENYTDGSVQIKQEVLGENQEDTPPVAKVPVLKLKIKKEHGTLNSSIIDEQNILGEKKKKKKKRRESGKNREKALDHTIQETNKTVDELIAQIDAIQPIIKQERLDDVEMRDATNPEHIEEPTLQPEATVMTSIPITQFQISDVSSGVEFNVTELNDETAVPAQSISHYDVNEQDIKPNKEELDRMFKITNISSGVDIFQESPPKPSKEPANIITSSSPKPAKNKISQTKTTPRVTQGSRAKAVKSTGGANKSSVSTQPAFSATDTFFGNISIKPEPVDRGYDEVCKAFENTVNVPPTQTSEDTFNTAEEQEYINSIDFNNIKIKQEKGLEVSAVEFSSTEIVANVIPNGLNDINSFESQASENEESNDDSDETDWEDDRESEKEVREYREMEMPPLLSPGPEEDKQKSDGMEAQAHSLNKMPSLTQSTVNERENEVSPQLQLFNDKETEQNVDEMMGGHEIPPSNDIEEKGNCHEMPIQTEMSSSNKEEEKQSGHDMSEVSDNDGLQTIDQVVDDNQPSSTPFVITAVFSQVDDDGTKLEAKPTAGLGSSDIAEDPSENVTSLKIINIEAACKSFDDITDKTVLPAVNELPNDNKKMPLVYVENKENIQIISSETGGEPSDNITDNVTSSATNENVIAHMDVDIGENMENLKIANVEAGCETNDNSDYKAIFSGTGELPIANDDIQMEVVEDKEQLLNAQPFTTTTVSYPSTSVEANEANEGDNNEANAVEEQQNALNHEVAALATQSSQEVDGYAIGPLVTTNVIATTLPNNTTFSTVTELQPALQPQILKQSTSDELMGNDEETENLMNESTVEAQRQQLVQEQRLPHDNASVGANAEGLEYRPILENEEAAIDRFLANDNINEIAENNNNANIERELQDDATVTEQQEQESVTEH